MSIFRKKLKLKNDIDFYIAGEFIVSFNIPISIYDEVIVTHIYQKYAPPILKKAVLYKDRSFTRFIKDLLNIT